VAGVPGLEPGPTVLETDMLTINTIPLRLKIPDSTFQISNLESEIWNLEFSVIYFLCANGGSGNDYKTF
jgi:hypothetical protein